jgi:hypothetical protein
MAVLAQDADLEGALRDLGLNDPQVTLDAGRALVVYQQPVAQLGPIEVELERIAQVLALFGEHLAAEDEVWVQQRFDDGQIMQVVGSPALGDAFLGGEIDAFAFETALRFEPLTRGPLIFEGTCSPEAGDTCETQPACACYPNERCQPADPAANPKGCVIEVEPANAHLEGSEYACNEGYVWNGEMTGCEAAVECPEGTQFMDGECVAASTDVDEAESTPLPPDEPLEEEGEEPLTGLLDPTWMLWAGGCCCLVSLLAILVVVVLLLRRRKRRSTAAEDVAPDPTMVAHASPAAVRPDGFSEVESRLRTLRTDYQSGAVDQATYQAEMKKLMVQDEEGRYWTLTEDGWYCYDGQRWVSADPPGRG